MERPGPEPRAAAAATYDIRHLTEYHYGTEVGFGRHTAMVRPRSGLNQRLVSSEVRIEPAPARLVWSSDPLENAIFTADFRTRSATLAFEATSRVEVTPTGDLDLLLAPSARHHPFRYAAPERELLAPAMTDPDLGPVAEEWTRDLRGASPTVPTLDLLHRLNGAIRAEFAYRRREERGAQNPSDTIARGSGTCRDFALLAVCALRRWRLAARFVSGYLHVPDFEPERVQGGGAMHAWAQAFLPGIGWLDLDPTNGRIGNAGLVAVAVGLEPDDLLTIAGSFVGRASAFRSMRVWVQVTRLDEPRADAPREAEFEAAPA